MIQAFVGLIFRAIQGLLHVLLSRVVGSARIGALVASVAARLFPGIQATVLGRLLGSLGGLPGMLIAGWVVSRLMREVERRRRAESRR